jgi:hypothetical protein
LSIGPAYSIEGQAGATDYFGSIEPMTDVATGFIHICLRGEFNSQFCPDNSEFEKVGLDSVFSLSVKVAVLELKEEVMFLPDEPDLVYQFLSLLPRRQGNAVPEAHEVRHLV